MRALALVLACLLIAGCGAELKRGDKSHARREVPPGPGLLTGKQGEFVIFRIEGEPAGEPNAAGGDEDAEQPSQ